jgi:Acetyltransferase (GNAT) family.
MMRLPALENAMIEIRKSLETDIPAIMDIVERNRRLFPGLETAEGLRAHEESLRSFIECGESLSAIVEGKVQGNLLYSVSEKELCFFIVDECMRGRGIGSALLGKMLASFSAGDEIWLFTYTEDDERGKGARAFYLRHGFHPDGITDAFGVPCEKFVLKNRKAPE